jgi:hypothetical protein
VKSDVRIHHKCNYGSAAIQIKFFITTPNVEGHSCKLALVKYIEVQSSNEEKVKSYEAIPPLPHTSSWCGA